MTTTALGSFCLAARATQAVLQQEDIAVISDKMKLASQDYITECLPAFDIFTKGRARAHYAFWSYLALLHPELPKCHEEVREHLNDRHEILTSQAEDFFTDS